MLVGTEPALKHKSIDLLLNGNHVKFIWERLQLRNNQHILCMEVVGGKVKRDAKIFGVVCAENGV